MFLSGHDRLSHQVSQVRPDDHIHWQAKGEQSGSRQKASTHAKETTHYTNEKAYPDKEDRIDVLIRDQEIHSRLR